jgi:hypothetical protein
MKKVNSAFSSPETARDWIAKTLDGWFSEQKASCYEPFAASFSFRLYPHEIVYDVYLKECPSVTKRRNFTKGVALLISEETMLSWPENQFLGLLYLGEKLGARAILESMTSLLKNPNLKLAPNSDLMASMIYTTALRLYKIHRGHPRNIILELLLAAREHKGVGASTLLVAFTEYDRDHWRSHFISLKTHLQEYSLARTKDEKFFELVTDHLVSDLQKALGKRRYQEEIVALEQAGHLEGLEWFIPAK